MNRGRFQRASVLAAAGLVALVMGAGLAPLAADPDPTPAQAPAAATKAPAASKAPAAAKKSATKKRSTIKKKKPKKKPAAKRMKKKSSEQRFHDDYRAAYALAEAGRHGEALTAFRALGHDEHPSVANMIGFLNRHLGHYEEAQVWYERALASDPAHVRTWQYYGMWHVEQGNLIKAREHLERIRALCGGEACREFAGLKDAIEGNVVY